MAMYALPIDGGGGTNESGNNHSSSSGRSFANQHVSGGGRSFGVTGNSYQNYNSTGAWNNTFGGSPLDYTSSNTAAGGRMQAEYLGGAMNIQGSNLKMIANYIYFYHLDRFCIIPLYPESINDNMDSTFSSTDALSRSAPVFSYSKSGPRSVNVQLQLHRDLMNDLNRGISNLKSNTIDFNGEDYVDTLVKYLQAAALPRYREYTNGSKSVEPPMVAVRFGNSVFIKGIINSGIQVTYQKPILADDKYAVIQITFNVYESDPYNADTVAVQGSFRGVCATNNIFRE